MLASGAVEQIAGIPLSVATPSALALSAIAMIVLSFVRGWIMSRYAVEHVLKTSSLLIEQANTRAEEYKGLYLIEKQRGDVLQGVVEELKIVGRSTEKILESLPELPHEKRWGFRDTGSEDGEG